MGKLDLLATITGLAPEIAGLDAFKQRDEIKAGLAAQLKTRTSASWMDDFVANDIWAAPVMDWDGVVASGVLQTLDMVQNIERGDVAMKTTKLPLRIDGVRPSSSRAAPELGDANGLLETGW
ncbi:MAG TPA: hypothetical protein DCY62_15395 [Thalassospira sp.]|nr:hypothetical protein [Thalassospira sp.]